ncbi:MAG: hypothetical protein ACI82F_004212 [Planctomycetota bacterium]
MTRLPSSVNSKSTAAGTMGWRSMTQARTLVSRAV